MKKATIILFSVIILTLYFNTGYLIASSFDNMATRQCNPATYTRTEKLLSVNGLFCINGLSIGGEVSRPNDLQFGIVIALWPIMLVLFLAAWFVKLFVLLGTTFSAVVFLKPLGLYSNFIILGDHVSLFLYKNYEKVILSFSPFFVSILFAFTS